MWVTCARSQLEAAVNTAPDSMQGLAQTTIMKAHRLLPTLFCFLVPAGLRCFLGLFIPAMNSSSVDADVRILTRSKSSTVKLTGSWPCTTRPNNMRDYGNGDLRHCVVLGSYQLAHSASNWNHTSTNGSISHKLT